MPDLGLHRLQASVAPAAKAVISCFPAFRPDAVRILVLSGIAVGLESSGIGLIFMLIKQFTHHTVEIDVPLSFVQELGRSPVALTLGGVALLTAGVRLKYMIIQQASKVALKAGLEAARLSVAQAHELFRAGAFGGLGDDQKAQQKMVGVLLKNIPFSCGFVAGGVTLVALNCVQVTVFLAILLWLNPLLTAVLLLLILVVFVLLSGSFQTVVSVANDRRAQSASHREESDDISASLFDPQVAEQDFARQTERALESGGVHQQLALRLQQRREKRSGSLVIEYVYPIAIVLVSLLYMYGGALAPHISEVALYFMLTRQSISSLGSIGNTLMSFSRHHSNLVLFAQIMDGTGDFAATDWSTLDDDDDD